jgi:hypothetical protein
MTVSAKALVPILALILSIFVTLVQGKSRAPVSDDAGQKWRVDLQYLCGNAQTAQEPIPQHDARAV